MNKENTDLNAKKLIFDARHRVVEIFEKLIDFGTEVQTPKEAELENTIGAFFNRKINKNAVRIAKLVLRKRK